MIITNELFKNINDLEMDNNTYESCTFSDLKIDNKVLVNVIFKSCNFSNSTFSSCGFHQVKFINCNLIGTSFIECSLKNVSIQDCNGLYLNIGKLLD